MKKRSAAFSASARSRFSRYAATTLPLCARYHDRAVGRRAKASQAPAGGDVGGPASPPTRATASQPSRTIRSFTARHHGLPGLSSDGGCSTPRRSCQCMNDIAARRNGRWRGASPHGPR